VVNTGTFAVQAAQSGTWTVTGAGGTFPVTGTFWQATQPVSIAGAVTVAQATAGSLNATVVGTGTFAVQAAQSGSWTVQPGNTPNTVPWLVGISNGSTQVNVTAGHALVVDGSGVTQPVSIAASVAVTGTFWQSTQPVSLSSLPALASGTNLVGAAAVGQQVGQVYNGTTAITPQYATFSTSSAGATQVVALAAGQSIYVLRWSVSANGATNVNLQSHTTTALATGVRYLPQYGSAGGAFCPAGIMKTASGEALDVNNSAAVAISGEVTYVVF
jgi:hypothetical protein